ncbi:MAG TPA: outer membrane beta-barrel protein [Allosphingosinicella sp.]|nr:outer membrane beta-barrel protein [Allosphingosinicella sp.]
MRKVALAALLIGTASTPAFAQDGTFTGVRAEAIVGYDVLKSGDQDDDGVDTGDDEGDESLEGAVYGIGVGYDFDLGGVVAGIEGEFTESSGKQETGETVDVPFSSRIETGRDLYVGGRIGFRVAPTTMIYGKAGYTNTAIEGQFAGDGDQFEFDSNVDGYRVGAGIEQLFGPNAYGKVEYRYSNYNTLDFSDDFDLGDLDPEDFQTDIDLDRHQVVASVGFRF